MGTWIHGAQETQRFQVPNVMVEGPGNNYGYGVWDILDQIPLYLGTGFFSYTGAASEEPSERNSWLGCFNLFPHGPSQPCAQSELQPQPSGYASRPQPRVMRMSGLAFPVLGLCFVVTEPSPQMESTVCPQSSSVLGFHVRT